MTGVPRITGHVWRTTVRLDPAEPYLRDHQPGGYPLLGTVGGLETIGRVACGRDPWMVVRAIEDVRLPGPVHFRDETALDVHVTGATTESDGRRSLWQLGSEARDGAAVHVTCRIVLAPDFGAPPPPVPAPTEPANAVRTEAIYRAFFHGPAFRVVASAWKVADGFAARLAAPLPKWSGDGRASVTSPRLIEFALQTAGLLQLEAEGKMRIPHAIARITRWTRRDIEDGVPLFAIARRRSESADQVYDIAVRDAAGNVALRVEGYACAPLPFRADSAELDRLASTLSST